MATAAQTRDFVYIDDVVEALVAAATAPVDRTIINVGSGEEMSINTLIADLGRRDGAQPEVIYNPPEAGGLTRLVADLTAARDVCPATNQVTLREGLGACWPKIPALLSQRWNRCRGMAGMWHACRRGRSRNAKGERRHQDVPDLHSPFHFPGLAAKHHQCVTTVVPIGAQLNSQAASEVRMFTQPWLIGRPKLLCQ